MVQRHAACIVDFSSLATELLTVSDNAIETVRQRVAQGDHASANNSEERTVLKLMQQVFLHLT